MSGTSTDAVDAVLADASMQIIASASIAIPTQLQNTLIGLNTPGPNELETAAIAANDLVDIYTTAVIELLRKSQLQASAIAAIGAHGQTVRHAPARGFSIQLNAPARLAEKTGITVVADFRSRDIAAGGQGAPLVPAFHAKIFGQNQHKAVLNLGGIANLTILDQEISGFDTGPANMLMDAWAKIHIQQDYDIDGKFAANGRCNQKLLKAMLAEPWLQLAPPKSTGRDLFNLAWLEQKIAATADQITPADTQKTLLHLTVSSICDAIDNYAPDIREIIVCGGGAKNPLLMATLAEQSQRQISYSISYGIDEQQMEALAFAWFAQANLAGIKICLPTVTGARHANIAGCIYPA